MFRHDNVDMLTRDTSNDKDARFIGKITEYDYTLCKKLVLNISGKMILSLTFDNEIATVDFSVREQTLLIELRSPLSKKRSKSLNNESFKNMPRVFGSGHKLVSCLGDNRKIIY